VTTKQPYYTIEEFKVDSKLSDQLNLAHVARNKKEETKTNVSAHFVWYRFKIREGSPEGTRKSTMEKNICETNDF